MDNTPPIDNVLRDLLKQLLFIGNAKPGHKLSFSQSGWRYQPDTIANNLLRTFSRDSRKDMITHIRETLNSTNLALVRYQSSPYFDVLIDSLKKAKNGLTIIKETYAQDIDTLIELDLFITEIIALTNFYSH